MYTNRLTAHIRVCSSGYLRKEEPVSVAYVSQERAQKALAMEKRFRNLPPGAGILFIGVSAVPSDQLGRGADVYEVHLGLSRSFEKNTGVALITKIFEEEIKKGDRILADVQLGVSGAARDEGDAPTRSFSS